MPDLKAVTITLRALPGAAETPAPPWWGRAVHALWLNVIEQTDAELAQRIHDGSDLRPYTLSSLMGRFPQGRILADEGYRLRITTLTPELSALLAEAIVSGPLAPGRVVTLDYHGFRVAQVDAAEGPWSGEADYLTLAVGVLARHAAPERRIALRFVSPTGFRSRGRHVPVPLPELVFGSLLQRWNAFAPIAFPDETRRYAEESLAIARYELRTRTVTMKNQGKRPGAVGVVSYATLNYDRYWMGVMQALAAFARFGGVGAGVTLGMGQCRVEPRERRVLTPQSQDVKEKEVQK